ncbi:MAG: aspartyl/asparaginyl beta-hydroxylase domain-containing protein [Actinomycetes bacterium]
MRTMVTSLVDPELDALLTRDGFVAFPLLPAEMVRDLRRQLVEQHRWGPSSDGDDASSGATGAVVVTDTTVAAIDDLLTVRFRDHQCVSHEAVAQFPGDHSGLLPHQEPSRVDEAAGHRGVVALVALDDLTGHNGQIRVLRGSHTIDGALRRADAPAPWLDLADAIERRLVTVPLHAGDCVILDDRLVRCAYPNHTDAPSVIARIALTETGVDAIDPTTISSGPGRSLTEADLAATLDTGMLARVDLVRHAVARTRDRVRADARTLTQTGQERWSHARAAARDRSAEVRSASREHVPTVQQLREKWHALPSTAAIGVLGVNEAAINKFGPETPAIWDPDQFDWARRIEAGYHDVRAEVEALLEGPTEIPHIEDVTGGIPQGNIGPWRSFVLMHQGRWIDWNCERCPKTTELVRSVPGLSMAGFSVLEPGTHITEHRGPNKGALRYQLGVIVPGEPGDCRIRVGDDVIVWANGEGCMFDFTVPHEAWNDSDGIRVLLMLEVLTPLPWYLDRPNRVAQRAMGWFPTTRDITNRLRALEPKLRKAS